MNTLSDFLETPQLPPIVRSVCCSGLQGMDCLADWQSDGGFTELRMELKNNVVLQNNEL